MTQAFTTFFARRSKTLTNTVRIAYGGRFLDTLALWDTGATNSCIASEIATSLDLEPYSLRRMYTPSGATDSPTYRIDLILPSGANIPNLQVCASEIGRQGLGLLIGMDVISLGDFATSCKDGRTMFTFRMPSVEDADYTAREHMA